MVAGIRDTDESLGLPQMALPRQGAFAMDSSDAAAVSPDGRTLSIDWLTGAGGADWLRVLVESEKPFTHPSDPRRPRPRVRPRRIHDDIDEKRK